MLVGINLLREGLDLPEVALVGVLDADKEGFLRGHRALIQTAGRAARNSEGKVVLYGDTITDSMKVTIEETARRRQIQARYNEQNGITPETIKKRIHELDYHVAEADYVNVDIAAEEETVYATDAGVEQTMASLEREMKAAAKKLEFERAAKLRDRLRALRQQELLFGESLR